MDCPSEENMIRMKLQETDAILKLEFDLKERTVSVFHTGDPSVIETAVAELNLGSSLIESTEADAMPQSEDDRQQRKILWIVLVINFAFFVIEMTTGVISKSMGLVADSLDMLADSLVYGLSLFAVGATLTRKKKVASISGYFQLILALIGFSEVIRRFIGIEPVPDFRAMVGVSILALAANVACLLILLKAKNNKEAHIRASIIFSSNDVIINVGVIIAGLAVWLTDSGIPDLIVGSIVFLVVIRGAFRILKLGK